MNDPRPRWTLTALFRIQRTGRAHRTAGDEDDEGGHRPWHRRPVAWALIAIIGLELIALALLGVLPR